GNSILENSVQMKENVEESTTSIKARKLEGMLAINLEKLESMLAEANDLFDQTDEPLEKIREIRKKENELRAAREKARLEAERRAREKAERLRKQKEREARIRRELENARGALREARRALNSHAYGKVAKNLSKEKSSYTTEEGKAAFNTVIQRYRLLEDTREYIIKRLSEKPMPWGWLREGGQREDVLGANKKHILLKNRKVPWRQVDARQMLGFINYYLARKDTMTLRQIGKYSLGAAVFSKEHGADKSADEFLAKALANYPRIKDQVDVVMADVLEEEE
ncbi:MAG: hypothetical protein ACOC6C_03720, partial [Verrucomicrobiota bacterium]